MLIFEPGEIWSTLVRPQKSYKRLLFPSLIVRHALRHIKRSPTCRISRTPCSVLVLRKEDKMLATAIVAAPLLIPKPEF